LDFSCSGDLKNNPVIRDESEMKQMSDDQKTLCKYKKEKLEEHFELIKTIVRDPKFICKKCGRVAAQKEWLCKPIALE
jgi:hypothetical protein